MKNGRLEHTNYASFVRKRENSIYEKYGKRSIDIILAVVALIVVSPIMLIVSVAIKLNSSGPVFFKQTRSGLNGSKFVLVKFRSMTANNNVYDSSQVDEVTKVGKIIRRTSIDEIPQLLNVVKGNMSIVGPRPWLPEYFDAMSPEQRRRYGVKPGITGLAQARGRNALTVAEKINCDLEYVQNVTLVGDIKIVILTIKTMFDESSLEIGKLGIQDELDFLGQQRELKDQPVSIIDNEDEM